MILATLTLAAAVALSPLQPVQTVSLAAHGAAAADVTWLNDNELLVALTKGGVVKVALAPASVRAWLRESPLPDGIPAAELIAANGDLVVVMGGGRRNFMFRRADGTYLHSYADGGLYPRGLAVSGGLAFYIGWVTRSGTDADQQQGVLWTQAAGRARSERPLHRIVSGDDALARWRLTMHPYGGAAVALPDGSVALITSAEPGIFRYGRDGKLLEVLGNAIDALVVDSLRLAKSYGRDVVGRYRDVLDRQPSIDDLVVTPRGVAILVRTAAGNSIEWQLWKPGRTSVETVQPLAPKANGPIGHMKCEARRDRLACVTNMPTAEQARQPGPAASNPTLLLYRLPK